MILTHKYRVKDRTACKRLSEHAIAANQVWNYCNAVQKDVENRYKLGAPKRRWPTHFDLTGLTSGCTQQLGIHADTIGEVCRIYVKSRNTAKHSLKFRASRGAKRALGWIPFRGNFRKTVDNGFVYKGHTFRCFGSKRRPLPSVFKTGAFVEDAQGRWWLTFQVEANVAERSDGGEVGIDLGLKALATMSDGTTVPAVQHYRQYEQRLAVAQRAGNKRRVSAIHAKIANARRDHLHKASTALVRENRLIVVGNVNPTKLKKTRMAKSVSDVGWSMFRNMLKYKCQQAGSVFIEADEGWTSRTCSGCGTIPDSSPKGIGALGVRSWVCSDCGESHDRDVNAARNILRIGLSTQPQADGSRRIAA